MFIIHTAVIADNSSMNNMNTYGALLGYNVGGMLVKSRQDEYEFRKVRRFSIADSNWVEDIRPTSVEQLLRIEVNGQPFRELLCSSGDMLDLAIGQLAQQGLVQTGTDIGSCELVNGIAQINTTSSSQAHARNLSANPRHYPLSKLLLWQRNDIVYNIHVEAHKALAAADKLLGELAVTHEHTNGVHSGVIYDPAADDILVFREDVGRHNVFDKLHGWSVRQDVKLADKMIIFSGRCSAEMTLKLWRMGCYIVLAKSVPTTLSLELADKLGITLMARLTKDGFSVYTHPQRVC